MLKKRIHRWDLDKKHKEPDMLVALRMALAREAQGKKTIFVIRNREVTLEEIKHYFKRKGVRDPRALLTGPHICTSTTSLNCYTPPPSPGAETTLASPDWEDLEEVDLDIGELSEDGTVYRFVVQGASEQSIPPSARRVCSSLPLPEGQRRLESLLMFTRACNESVAQIRGKRRMLPIVSYHSFTTDIVVRCALQQLGRIQEAFVCFNEAFDSVHRILKSDSWLTLLPNIYELTGFFAEEENTEILDRLCDFVVQLSGVYVERVRPLKEAMTVLIQIPSQERADSAARGLDYLFENPASVTDLSRYFHVSYGTYLDCRLGDEKVMRIVIPEFCFSQWERWERLCFERKSV